jgi:hypothetical protein
MQPVSREDLKQLIKEAEAAGKDVSELKESMETMREAPSPKGERKERSTEEGTVVIESTGPAREDDFEWGK